MSRTKLAFYALAATLSAGAASAADKVIFQLDWLPGGDKAPIYVCIQEGFCSQAGLEVEIASGRGSTHDHTRRGERFNARTGSTPGSG